MTYTIQLTKVFADWLRTLRDHTSRVAIAKRLDRIANGNFGDYSSVGDGVSEFRIFTGKGYRLYFIVRNDEIIVLLCGGHKDSQQRDIKKAKEMAEHLERDNDR